MVLRACISAFLSNLSDDLIVDPRNLEWMREANCPVVADITHSPQQPAGKKFHYNVFLLHLLPSTFILWVGLCSFWGGQLCPCGFFDTLLRRLYTFSSTSLLLYIYTLRSLL